MYSSHITTVTVDSQSVYIHHVLIKYHHCNCWFPVCLYSPCTHQISPLQLLIPSLFLFTIYSSHITTVTVDSQSVYIHHVLIKYHHCNCWFPVCFYSPYIHQISPLQLLIPSLFLFTTHSSHISTVTADSQSVSIHHVFITYHHNTVCSRCGCQYSASYCLRISLIEVLS